MESKRIGTFKEFLKQQQQKKINEAKVEIQCDFWDSAQVEVMQDLTDECNGFLDYNTLVRYVKNKFQILGREEPGYEEALLLAHIKDLIFFHHGNSLYTTGGCSYGEDNAEVQAKGLVVGELAKAILEKVLETIQTTDDPIPGTTSVSLTDKEPRTLIPMTPVCTCDDYEDEYYEDLPYESHKVKPVKGFHEYTKALNETVAVIDCTCQDECIKYCMDRVKEEVGNYDPDGILITAARAVDPRVKARLILIYVKDMVIDYMTQEKAQLGLVDVNGNKGKAIPKDVLEQGLDTLFHDIADQVLEKIANENGVYYAEVESD